MENDFFSEFINKYTNLNAPEHHEYLSCLDLMCQELATYAKTKGAVGGKTIVETDQGMLRAYSIRELSYLNGTDKASVDNDGPAWKKDSDITQQLL